MIFNKGQKTKLGKYFSSNEFDCPCHMCDETIIDLALIEKLDKVRDEFNAPITITSGYRCESYQKALASRGYETAKGISQHQLGKAADITPSANKSLPFPNKMVLLKELVEKHFLASGQGSTFFHVDLRADKERRWTYIKR